MNAPAGSPPESTNSPWKVFGVPALLALVGYVGFYACDARLRTRRGPWEVTFKRDADGTPAVGIAHPDLAISNIWVRFPGESLAGEPTNLPATLTFAVPEQTLPFGKLAFEDLTYLPGTVVLHCFGHEVQMLPRWLYLDRSAKGWTNNARYDLVPATKPAQLEPPPKKSARPPQPR